MPSGGDEEPPSRLRRGTATITVFRIFGDESYTTSGEFRVQGALGRTDEDEAKLRGFLNRSGSQSRFTVKLCRSVQSHSEDLIQLTDLLVGAIGWEWNGRQSSSSAKEQLHAHICERLGCDTLRRTTFRHPKFDLWQYQRRSQHAA